MSGYGIESMCFALFQQVLNRSLTRIVSGQRQAPIFEVAVEIPEVFCRCFGALFGFETLIEQAHAEAITFRGIRCELKQSGCARRTARARVEGRFYLGNPNQLGRHFLCHENWFQARDIGLCPLRPGPLCHLFDPNLTLFLWGWIGPWFWWLAWNDFRRWDRGAESFRDVQVIEASL